MSVSPPIRVALVGCGNIGTKGHIPAYAELANASITAVCDRDAKLASVAGDLLGVPAYTDLADLLAKEAIDAVDICTPPQSHAELAVQAAEAGKHVLCEKPIAHSLEDADAMITSAKAHGVKLMVGHVRRFDNRYAAIKEQVASGRLGRPVYIRRAERQFLPFPPDAWYWHASIGGGVILDIGVHALDLLRWLFDDEPVEISTIARAVRPAAKEAGSFDYAMITCMFAGGGIGFAEASWAHPGAFGGGQYSSLDVLGTEGKLEYSDRDSNPMLVYDETDGPELPRYFSLMSSTEYAFGAQIRHFVDSVANNTDPIAAPSDARFALSMALAAQRSAETGKAVKMSDADMTAGSSHG